MVRNYFKDGSDWNVHIEYVNQGKPQGKFLNKASQMYSKVINQLEKFQRIFPFAFDGETPKEKCFEGAEILRATKPFETQALIHLKESYEAWV